jgi:YVTN family beta-propeller protein
LPFSFTPLHATEYGVVARYFIGGTGGHDYLRVDSAARRIYVAHEKKFEVLDADSGKKVGEIGPTQRAHGTAISPETGHGFVSSGSDNRITMFDTKTLAVIKQIKSTGSNPDGIEYDSGSQRVYAANHGSGEITVIDPATGDIVGTVKFGEGKLEGIAFDGRGQGFVNAEDKSSVFVFDLKTLMPKAKWSVAPTEGGTGLACDEVNHRLFMACSDKLVVLDSDTGKVVARVSIGEDPDGLAFDHKDGLIYVSSSDSTLTVVHADSADKYSVVATVHTQPGARTVALDEKTGHVVLCAPKYGPKPAPVAGGPRQRPPILPDTFEVIVVGQK